jgi:PAS domain S-box-containing protein
LTFLCKYILYQEENPDSTAGRPNRGHTMAAKVSSPYLSPFSTLGYFMDTFEAAVLIDGYGHVLEVQEKAPGDILDSLRRGRRVQDVLPELVRDVSHLTESYPSNTPHEVTLHGDRTFVLQVVSNTRKSAQHSRLLLLLNEKRSSGEKSEPTEYRPLKSPAVLTRCAPILEILFQHTKGVIFMLDRDHRIIGVNMAAYQVFESDFNDLLNVDCRDLMEPEHTDEFENALKTAHNRGGWSGELRPRRTGGETFPADATINRMEHLGDPAYLVTMLDTSRQCTLKHLLEEEKLKIQEMTVALKTLASTIEEEKRSVRGEVAEEIKEEILPALERMSRESGEEVRREFLESIREQLEELAAHAPTRESGKMLKLTPTEQEVCRLIRANASSKQMAEMLHCSLDTVQTHRKHIRDKLGLKGKKTSLYSYLKNLRRTG